MSCNGSFKSLRIWEVLDMEAVVFMQDSSILLQLQGLPQTRIEAQTSRILDIIATFNLKPRTQKSRMRMEGRGTHTTTETNPLNPNPYTLIPNVPT